MQFYQIKPRPGHKISRWPGLNRRPTAYKAVALPLSYIGAFVGNSTIFPGLRPVICDQIVTVPLRSPLNFSYRCPSISITGRRLKYSLDSMRQRKTSTARALCVFRAKPAAGGPVYERP